MSDGKSGTMTIKAKAATANDELVCLKQQVLDLIAVVNVKGQLLKRIAPIIEIKQIKDLSYLGVLVNKLVLLDNPK